MRRSSVAALAAALFVALACGGGSKNPAGPDNSNNGSTGGSMSASIDGTAWSSIAVYTGKASGIAVISGSDIARTVTISFATTGIGTQTIGPGSVAGGQVAVGLQAWQAKEGGLGSGSVTLNTVTSTHAVGTFAFTAVATQGVTPAQRQVTNGTFDVRY